MNNGLIYVDLDDESHSKLRINDEQKVHIVKYAKKWFNLKNDKFILCGVNCYPTWDDKISVDTPIKFLHFFEEHKNLLDLVENHGYKIIVTSNTEPNSLWSLWLESERILEDINKDTTILEKYKDIVVWIEPYFTNKVYEYVNKHNYNVIAMNTCIFDGDFNTSFLEKNVMLNEMGFHNEIHNLTKSWKRRYKVSCISSQIREFRSILLLECFRKGIINNDNYFLFNPNSFIHLKKCMNYLKDNNKKFNFENLQNVKLEVDKDVNEHGEVKTFYECMVNDLQGQQKNNIYDYLNENSIDEILELLHINSDLPVTDGEEFSTKGHHSSSARSHDINMMVYKNSYVNVCFEVESRLDDNRRRRLVVPYTTEKVFKSIITRTPFFLFSEDSSHMLTWLRDNGFKTFNKVGIDENYDTIGNNRQRVVEMSKSLQTFNEKSRQELHEWYWSDDVQDILNHNYNRYFDFAKEEIKKVVEIML